MRPSWPPSRVPPLPGSRSRTTRRVPPFIYAADQNSGNVFVFNSQWEMTGNSRTPMVFPPVSTRSTFRISMGMLYVTYTNQSIPSGGIVDEFKPDGTFVGRLINDPTGKWLDNPWGLTIAPQSFGKFGGDLLVGNNGGNNWINAFDPMNGALQRGAYPRLGSTFQREQPLGPELRQRRERRPREYALLHRRARGKTDGLFGSLQAIPSLSAKAPIVPNLPNGAFQTVTTIPANGDLNPYGVAFVPPGFPSGGTLQPRRHPGLELQQQPQQPEWDRHNDRRHLPERRRIALLPESVHARSDRAGHRPGHLEERLRHRR